ncbi:MAG: branched-chain amino acid transaminase [Calditrichaeota bacterium]|nr:MAG: branched-chain amino acid transaminase [Calditrichota bacterium]
MFETTHFPGAKKYWYNGRLVDWNRAELHVMTHALHYGTSVFEGIRAYLTDRGPAVFRLSEHIDRLFHSAEVMRMEVPYSKKEIVDTVLELMRVNELKSAYIRPLLFYSYGNLGLVPHSAPVELVIGCWEWGAYLGEEAKQKGVHVLLLPWRRFHRSQIDLSAKLGGVYVQSKITAEFARRQGFNEGIMLNLEGRIAEGPGENIFIVKEGVVKTNPGSESILEGITRSSVLEIARDAGYPTEVGPISVEEFISADEAFFTGTAAEITPITRVTDGSNPNTSREDWKHYTIGDGVPGGICRHLATLYSKTVRGQLPQFEHWLSYVYRSREEAQAVLGSFSAAS